MMYFFYVTKISNSQLMGGHNVVAGKKPSAHREKKKPEAMEKKASAKAQVDSLAHQATPALITLDRRKNQDRRTGLDRRKENVPVSVERRVAERRAKVNRRRQIDPTTCERDYTNDEIEFMNALDNYKRRSGRMFPTCSEILEVLKSLGYEKRPQPPASETPSQPSSTNSSMVNVGSTEGNLATNPTVPCP